MYLSQIKSAKHGDLISMKKVLELSVDIDATEKDEVCITLYE